MQRNAFIASFITALGCLPAVCRADLSANVGWVSDYIYRGVYQEDSSAFGGLDFEDDSGVYAGVWGADVGRGMEVDLYFGYSGTAGDNFGYTIGWTGYFYTEDNISESFAIDNDLPIPADPGFYDTITEVNLGISYGIFSLDHSIGEEDGWGMPTDYTFTTVTIAPEVGPYYSLNAFGDEYSGTYLEIGYGWELMELDLGVAFMYADSDLTDPKYALVLSDNGSFVDTAITFSISKSFSLGDD